jgi:predicted amino acid-binding ACT domain protein
MGKNMVRRKLLRSAVSLLTVMTMVLGGTLTAYAGINYGETQKDAQEQKNTVDLNGNSDGLTVTVEQGNTVTVNILTEADQVANGESSSENGNAGSGTSSDEQTALANEIKSTIGDLGGRVSKLSTTNPTELGGKDGVTHIEERLKTWTKYNNVDKETVLEWLDKLKQVGIKTPEYTPTKFPGSPGTYEVESSSNLVTADLRQEAQQVRV